MAAPDVNDGLSTFSVRRYGPGESVTFGVRDFSIGSSPYPAKAGDFVLTHSLGAFGALIRLGERIRYHSNQRVFAHWSHAAIFVDDDGDIIEALGGGVQSRSISVYRDTEYAVVHLPLTTSGRDRRQAVEFANHCLNDEYGWLTIVSIAISLLSITKLNLEIDGQQICSGLVARCLERIGEIFTEGEPWHLMPADLAKHFNVIQIGERGRIPSPDFGVRAFSKPGKRTWRATGRGYPPNTQQ